MRKIGLTGTTLALLQKLALLQTLALGQTSGAILLPLGRVPGVGLAVGGALSGDGRTFYANFTGPDTYYSYVWREGTGFQPVVYPRGWRGASIGVSSRDGQVAGGSVYVDMSPLGTQGAVWLQGPSQEPRFDIRPRSVRAVSPDGSAWGGDDQGALTGFYVNGVFRQLAPINIPGEIHGLSEFGRVAVGRIAPQPGQPFIGTSFVWTESAGLRRLPALPGFTYDSAHHVTPDGSLVLGFSVLQQNGQNIDNRLWLWSETAGRTIIDPPLPTVRGLPARISADGRILASTMSDLTSGRTSVWLRFNDAPGGPSWVSFTDHLSRFGVSAAGWENMRLIGMSEDALTFAGEGFYNGQFQHWYARVPTPGTASLLLAAGALAWRRARR
jgi:hypothetical protein